MFVITQRILLRTILLGALLLALGAVFFMDRPTSVIEYIGLGLFYSGWVTLTITTVLYFFSPSFVHIDEASGQLLDPSMEPPSYESLPLHA